MLDGAGRPDEVISSVFKLTEIVHVCIIELDSSIEFRAVDLLRPEERFSTDGVLIAALPELGLLAREEIGCFDVGAECGEHRDNAFGADPHHPSVFCDGGLT